jgi:cAMP-dependent protein kinase regulator
MVRSAQAAVYDEYLEANMRVVLEALVEALLTKRPDDVERFCLDFLLHWQRNHGDDQEGIQRLTAERDAALRRKEAVLKQLEALGPLDGALEEEPPEEDEDEEARKIRAIRSTPRRAGVTAQRIDDQAIAEYRKPVHEKSDEEVQQIKTALQESKQMQVICGHLDSDALTDVINAFYLKDFEQNTDIIKQGDDGDSLYIVKDGSVDIFVARPGPDGKLAKKDKGPKVVTFEVGALFGELALMYSAPRAATVTVSSPSVSAWVMDALDFKMLMIQSSQAQYAKYEGWLAGVDLLKSLNHFELSRLADVLEQLLLDPDEELVRQGEAGNCFYILEDGEVSAFITGDFGEKEVKRYDKVGDYFGEIALLSDAPRAATIRATGPEGAAVVKLSKEDFNSLLGPIEDILREHIDQYPHYADFLTDADHQRLAEEHPEDNA